MNTYRFSFSGHWLTGVGVVTAETKEEAFEMAKEEIAGIDDESNDKWFNIDSLVELQTNMKNITILFNGDY